VRFQVVPVRKRGVPIDRARLAREPALTGELLVEEHHDQALGRNARTAKLRDPTRPRDGDLLPVLYDAQLLWMAPQGFMLSGFERVQVGGAATDYAQSWWCRPA
jgi:hypothetical protein